MKITLVQFVSLDGVSQGPGSPDEDTSDGFTRGGWLVPHIDEAFLTQASTWLDRADALVFGSRTYEAFARDWPEITDDADPFTERMNRLPKYVVSTTLTEGSWHPTTMLGGDIHRAAATLRERDGGEAQIHGSARLGASLLDAGLVDVVRLVVAPVVVGEGRRLFRHPSAGSGLRLVAQSTTPSGLLLLEYETTGRFDSAEYRGAAAYAGGQ